MKIQNGLLFFILLSGLITGAFAHTGCANIVPPMGGPRDSLPPVLVNALPRDSSKHVNDKKIVFTFDEYIDGKDIRGELIVSPVPKVEPITDSRLRTVTVRLKDTLQPNTTYSLNFYKGIRDVNEGNILRNFTYVFSTGDHIDSGQFEGNVLVAITGKVDTSMVVILHKKFDDSSVIKDRPRYITRVDSTGHFLFRFIEPGRYAVYAIKDEGGSHKYLSKSQLFAFADSPVFIRQNTPPVILYAYAEQAETKSNAKTTTGTNPPKPPPKSKKDKKDTRLQVLTNIANGVFDVLDTFRLSFTTGLRNFDSTLIRFTDENFKDINGKQYRFVRDTTKKNFALYYTWPWPVDTKFNLILAKNFAVDSAGRKLLKDDTITFRTKKDIEYGEVRIRVFNLDLSRHPVLQFFQSDALKYAIPFGNRKEIRKFLFRPGDYELRILYDANNNGKWDPGSFFGKRRQPEKATPILKKFTVKANWDNDRDITLSP